jgi:hypothetical protein
MLTVQGRMVSEKAINEIQADNMGRRRVSSMPPVIRGRGQRDRCVSYHWIYRAAGKLVGILEDLTD